MSAETVEQGSSDSRDAFYATNGAEAPPAPAPVVVEEAPAEVTPAPAAEDPKTEPSLIEGMTNEQIKSLLAKAAAVDDLQKEIRNLNGRYGELNQKLLERASAPAVATPTAPAATPTDPVFEGEYPEFANYAQEVSRKAIEAAMAKLPQGASSTAIEDAIVQAQAGMERKLMAFMHPDWNEVLAQDDYKLWLNTQPPEVQTTATTTTEALELGKVLTSFKDWKTKSSDATQRNRQRLQQGLAPTGTVGQSAHVPNDQDAARAAYNAIRGLK